MATDIRLVTVKRSFNLGGFDSLSLELQAQPDVGEDPEKVMDELTDRAETFAQKSYGNHVIRKKH
jgi:hypothetical protein